MRTQQANWQYIAEYKEEVQAIVALQLAELQNSIILLHPVYFFTQKWMQHINDGGSVINISTGTTRFRNPGYSIYSSMKSAVETFTKHVAAEYGNRQIRANIVAPGPIETDFNGAAIRNNPQLKAMLGERTPLGRVGVAEDIGGVVAFLCTEDARWINGQRIEVAGGINM